MKGHLKEGDLLTLKKTPLDHVLPGDIVVFSSYDPDNSGKEIVHRVIRRSSDFLVTRGDAAAYEDAKVVENNLVGKVIYRERNGRISHIYGGWIGLCRGRWLHFYWSMRRRIIRWIQRPYCMVKESGIVRHLWKPRISRVKINTENGPYIQYIWRKIVIARSWPEERRFECRKPWDLVISAQYPGMDGKL